MTTPKPRFTFEIELNRLKTITRHMLEAVEISLKAEMSAGQPPEKETPRQAAHNRLFGAKASLVETLATLADLTFKLHTVSPDEPEALAEPETVAVADRAIIEAFIRKRQGMEKPSA